MGIFDIHLNDSKRHIQNDRKMQEKHKYVSHIRCLMYLNS